MIVEMKRRLIMKKRNDVWGRDTNTGAEGLEIGHRTVKNGAVKIDHVTWVAVRGSLASYEGKMIEVSCSDAWATKYDAIDPETLEKIATLVAKKTKEGK